MRTDSQSPLHPQPKLRLQSAPSTHQQSLAQRTRRLWVCCQLAVGPWGRACPLWACFLICDK